MLLGENSMSSAAERHWNLYGGETSSADGEHWSAARSTVTTDPSASGLADTCCRHKNASTTLLEKTSPKIF